MNLGEGASGKITIDDIRGSDTHPPLFDNTTIAEGATILMLGCKAGKKNGIVSETARVTNARIYASEELVRGVRRKAFGRYELITPAGTNTVVHGAGPLKATYSRLRSRFARK